MATAKELHISKQARVRLGEVFDAYETNRKSRSFAMITHHDRLYGGPPESLGEAAARIVRRRFGEETKVDPFDLKGFCLRAEPTEILYFVMGAFAYLRDLERMGGLSLGASLSFAEQVNEITATDGFPYFFEVEKVGWTLRVSSDAEALRRALLANPSDMAECKQADPQVEMVVSTVQAALVRPNPVIIDYGAGLGRILLGFGTAERFRNATYVPVDEPVSDAVRSLAKTVGAKFEPMSREAFLRTPTEADVVILVNTLHHIPFDDLPRQIGTILTSLKAGGVLVIQEIGELRQPEQLNVPWRIEDIIDLFKVPGCISNPRSTTTRSQRIPLTHMLVHVDGAPPSQDLLAERCRAIWKSMKARALDELSELYASRDQEKHILLEHALFTNANLDLNKPA